jgi:activating signal cointegrator complex subunit 2
MRYVPKISSPANPQPPLTTALRSAAPAASSSTSSSRPDAYASDDNFVVYLPHDEAVASGLGPDAGGLDAVESQAVVDLLNDELAKLLKMKPRDFWKEGKLFDSLMAECFLSFLKCEETKVMGQFNEKWNDNCQLSTCR